MVLTSHHPHRKPFFPEICKALHSSPVAPPTTLVHTFYDSPWQALPGSPALINRVMFGRLAVEIERNLAHARLRGVEPQIGNPIVLVIAYLQQRSVLEGVPDNDL